MRLSQFVEREINHNVTSLIGLFQHRNVNEMEEKYLELVCHLDEEGEPVDIFEYWSVSQWLAEQLKDRNEPVVTDFYGFPVWGRTTTGQAIKMDHVIRDIYREHYA